MAWCDECSRFLPAGAAEEAGQCPECGNPLAGDAPNVPWHFKLLVVATVAYLAWRAVQGLVWLAGRL